MKKKMSEGYKALIALILMIALFALASHLEQTNLQEDRQAQEDCRIEDTESNLLFLYNIIEKYTTKIIEKYTTS